MAIKGIESSFSQGSRQGVLPALGVTAALSSSQLPAVVPMQLQAQPAAVDPPRTFRAQLAQRPVLLGHKTPVGFIATREAVMFEAIVLTREYDGTYTVGVGGSLILSDLNRTTAHQFVAKYRQLATTSDRADRGIAEKAPSTGARLGQVMHRSPSSSRPVIRIDRRQG